MSCRCDDNDVERRPAVNTPTSLDDPIRPAPDPLADEPACLLQGALAEAWPEAPAAAGVRERLAARAARAARVNAAMVNVRRRDRVVLERTPDRLVQQLYARDGGVVGLRNGEPVRVRLAELAPRSRWMVPAEPAGTGRDWLLLRGSVQLLAEGEPALALGALDHHAQGDAASRATACVAAGEAGATLLLRECAPGARAAQTSREAPGQWADYAPLIKRRVLWRQGPQAAMLWLAAPGANVPQHRHGHDEECLMLRGELFQDDYLLREGDYQLAPFGSLHETVNTDTGALIYAHGDLEMQFCDG